MIRLGLLGGTFNPVHFGHLRVAEEIAEYFRLDEIHFIPAADPPHKRFLMASFTHRLGMLRLATANHPGFVVSEVEETLPRPSYTVNTMKAISRSRPGELFFLVGFDSFRSIGQWFEGRSLMDLVSVVVFQRPGTRGSLKELDRLLNEELGLNLSWDPQREAFSGQGRNVFYYRGARLVVSSTDLRQRLAQGRSVRYLLPDGVREYIASHGLYSK